MTFRDDAIENFQRFFDERKSIIRSFEGCTHLELWQDTKHVNVFFTYSHWQDENALLHYRNSSFFRETWQLTKEMFAEKAEAWSVKQLAVLS
jgi:heme-degrading monooxygenase HmoA